MSTNRITLIDAIVLIILAVALSAFGQTNPPAPSLSGGISMIADSVASSTNWTVIGGYGHSTEHKNNLAFADLAYNLNQNVGLVAGYDKLWSPVQASEANIIKGGVSLSAKIHPFAFVGSTFLTNIVGTPFVADLLATPRSGSDVGNIVTTGINFDLCRLKNFDLGVGAQYEKRMGQGAYNGNYVLVHFGLSRRF